MQRKPTAKHRDCPNSCGLSCRRTRPRSPQCIELSAVCNSKNASRNRFVTLFGIPEHATASGVGGGRAGRRVPCDMSNPTAIAPVGKPGVFREESAISVGGCSRQVATRRKPFHATFVLHRGILERTRLHLTNLGTAAGRRCGSSAGTCGKNGRAAPDGQPMDSRGRLSPHEYLANETHMGSGGSLDLAIRQMFK